MSLQTKIDEVRAAFEALSLELRYAPKRLAAAIAGLDEPESDLPRAEMERGILQVESGDFEIVDDTEA